MKKEKREVDLKSPRGEVVEFRGGAAGARLTSKVAAERRRRCGASARDEETGQETWKEWAADDAAKPTCSSRCQT